MLDMAKFGPVIRLIHQQEQHRKYREVFVRKVEISLSVEYLVNTLFLQDHQSLHQSPPLLKSLRQQFARRAKGNAKNPARSIKLLDFLF